MFQSIELINTIAQTHLSTDGYGYIFLRFPLAQSAAVKRWLHDANIPYFCALWDDKEFSLMVKQEHWKIASPILQEAAYVSPIYKRITFDVVLEFDLVGYLDVMTRVLASANIPILAFSAFSRDHIFVQQSDFERAWDALQAYILCCSAKDSTPLSPELVSKK